MSLYTAEAERRSIRGAWHVARTRRNDKQNYIQQTWTDNKS